MPVHREACLHWGAGRTMSLGMEGCALSGTWLLSCALVGPMLVTCILPSTGRDTCACEVGAEESVGVKSICSWSLRKLLVVEVRSGIDRVPSTARIKKVVDPQREVNRCAVWRLSLSLTASRACEVAGFVVGRVRLAPVIGGYPLNGGRHWLIIHILTGFINWMKPVRI